MKVKLRRLFQALVLPAVAAILLLVNQMLATQFSDARALADESERVHLLREQLLTILSVHQDIETGQRGYVLTARSSFLGPYVAAEARLAREFAELDALAAGRPQLRTAVAELHALSEQKRAFVTQTIALTRAGRQDEAERLIASQRGLVIMNALRARIARAGATVASELERMRVGRTATRARTERVAYALQTLLVVLLVVAAWLLMRSLRAERRIARKFRESNARHEALFDASTDGLVIHDEEGIIETVNPTLAAMHGYTPEELAGRHIDIFLHTPFDRDRLRSWLRRVAKTPRGSPERTRELVGCRKDGSTYPADVVMSMVMLDDRPVFLAAVRDATSRKRVEQIKDEFVATVSHELRTPLTSIAGSLGLLGGGAAGALPEKAMRLIKIAHNNSERLVRLVNDILDIEKIESGKMVFNLKWVALGPLLEQAVHATRGFAGRHQVELELSPPPADAAVIADEDRLIQVITNLLSNAVKFSPSGEKVRIGLEARGDKFRISVSDAGPGIPEAFRERIFGKFAQADVSDARSKSGTGLGLAIAREIVTRLGGTIGYETMPGEGTIFHVDLPAANTEEIARLERPRRRATDLPQILHLETDPDVQRAVAEAFAGKADVHAITSLREGFAVLGRVHFDAAILEAAVTDGSALALLPLLREGGARVPSVLFTIHDVSPSYEAKVDAVLMKSEAGTERLVERVMRLIGGNAEG